MANYIFEREKLLKRLENLFPAMEDYSASIVKHNEKIDVECNKELATIQSKYTPNHAVETQRALDLLKKLNRKRWWWQEKVCFSTALEMVQRERERNMRDEMRETKWDHSTRKINGDKYFNRYNYLIAVCQRADDFDLIQLDDAECEMIDALDKLRLTEI